MAAWSAFRASCAPWRFSCRGWTIAGIFPWQEGGGVGIFAADGKQVVACAVGFGARATARAACPRRVFVACLALKAETKPGQSGDKADRYLDFVPAFFPGIARDDGRERYGHERNASGTYY